MATKTIRRVKTRSMEEMDDGEKFALLRMYKAGDSLGSIAKHFNIAYKSLESFISKEYQQFLVAKETRALLSGPETQQYRTLIKPSYVTDDFMAALDEGAWETYAFHFAISNDNKGALKEAGLLCGLLKPRGEEGGNYNSAVRLRGQYLRSLPQVREEIDRVKLACIKDKDINTPYLQSELVQQLDQLKEVVHDNPTQRSSLIKCIELLGKSCGAWIDTVKVETVDPSSALDHLIEMAKANPTPSVVEGREEYEAIPYADTDIEENE